MYPLLIYFPIRANACDDNFVEFNFNFVYFPIHYTAWIRAINICPKHSQGSLYINRFISKRKKQETRMAVEREYT